MIKKYLPLSESNCYILLSIFSGDKHGYAIMQQIKEMTENKLTLSNGTLYGALTRMTEDGILTTYISTDKKIYKITDEGKELLNLEQKRLTMLYSNMNNIMK